MMARAFNEWFQDAVSEYPPAGSDRHYRWGQHFFNYLAAHNSALANSVPPDVDPFHNDENIPSFLSWVCGHWYDDEGGGFHCR